jgi:hypothetical protein
MQRQYLAGSERESPLRLPSEASRLYQVRLLALPYSVEEPLGVNQIVFTQKSSANWPECRSRHEVQKYVHLTDVLSFFHEFCREVSLA